MAIYTVGYGYRPKGSRGVEVAGTLPVSADSEYAALKTAKEARKIAPVIGFAGQPLPHAGGYRREAVVWIADSPAPQEATDGR